MNDFGVSFSIKQCRNFKISPTDCLTWLIQECGFKRFRLMSYWDEAEPTPGNYDFTELDRQVQFVEAAGGSVSLCLGVKQPRWPEAHWPDWAWELPSAERDQTIFNFVEVVVKRYREYKCIISYQLENEALLKFGTRPDVNPSRLRQEFKLVKQLDPKRPIVMTTSTSWGIPFRKPIPDIVGFSFYQILYRADLQKYTTAFHKPWMDRLRALAIKILWRKPSFIHELQLEPWGPKNIWEMPVEEQMKSMSIEQIGKNVALAKNTHLTPIDLWGGEWWYWSQLHGNPKIAKAIIRACG